MLKIILQSHDVIYQKNVEHTRQYYLFCQYIYEEFL